MSKIVQLGNTSLQAIYDKYGGFAKIEELNPGGFFDEFHLFTLYSGHGNKIELKNRVTVHEFNTAYHCHLLEPIIYAFQFIWILIYLCAFIWRHKIDVIHSKEPLICGAAALILSRITRVPFCVSIHADYDQRYKVSGGEDSTTLFGSHDLVKKVEEVVLPHADMVMPIRESLIEYATQRGTKPERIRIIPHGIELSPFLQDPNPALKHELGIDGRKVVSFVGRLTGDNYTDDVVRIAEKVTQTRKGVVFLLAGDGKRRTHLEEMSHDLCLTGDVMFLGFQPQDKVAQIRLVSDVSLCLMAGFSLIEAAAAGVPIVSYDVEWHYELVKDGETGFLVPGNDVQGAADAILKILGDAELSKRMGENARRLAVERHSKENTDGIKVKWYKELINKKEGRRR